jgi:hypothetical protein
MVCSKCQCDFCYNCGRRRLGMKFLGSHESRFSPLGCKYNLYPDKPILRHTVRGLIAGAATLAIPVAAVGAVALLAIGTTIGAPTYGTYRLVKHIRSQRQQRRRRHHMETQSTTNDSLSTYINGADQTIIEIDHYQRALQASLITFREENHRREQREITPYPIRRLSYFNQNDNDNDDDDDDDDSYDD